MGVLNEKRCNTEDDCEKILKYASQNNISISHKCCDGKGCGIKI